MKMLRVITAGFLFAVLVPPIGSAAAPQELAPRKRPPKARIVADEGVQRGVLWSFCWTYTEGDWGVGSCGDGSYVWRTPLEVPPRSKAKLTFGWGQMPSHLSIRGWSRVGRDDLPRGSGRRLAYRLRPERSPGEGITGWAAHFRVPDRTGHFYVSSFAKWDGGSSGGDASHSFHLRLE